MSHQQKTVVVIGAGAAGLSSACQLIKAGYNVTVLDANNYIGGRIKSLTYDTGNSIELGASLLHSKKLELYTTAKKQSSLGNRFIKPAFILNNRLLGLWRLLTSLSMRDFIRSGNIFNMFYRYNKPQDAGLDSLISDNGFSDVFQKILNCSFALSTGTALRHVGIKSLRYSFSSAGLKVEKDLVSLPLKAPFISLLAEYIECVSPRIKLQTIITSIDYSDEKIRVSSTTGELFHADYVIVTVPLSILQTGTILFTPALPQEKSHAISKLGMGKGAKVAMRFRQKFWNSNSNVILDCDHCFMYFSHQLNNSEFILIAYLIDENITMLDDSELKNFVVSKLDGVFQGKASAQLIDCKIQNWAKDTNFLGTYSYDAKDSVGCREILAKPVHNKLFFAGEATINGHAASVDGALLSGKRAAQEIMSLTRDQD